MTTTPPDPVDDITRETSGRISQLAYLLAQVADSSVRIQHSRTERRNAQGRTVEQQQLAQRRQAEEERRTHWARSADAAWRTYAAPDDLLATWHCAAQWADHDRYAAAAQQRCEAEMRRRWPHPMRYYDELRADGSTAVEAFHRTFSTFRSAGWDPTQPPAHERPQQQRDAITAGRLALAGGPAAETHDQDAAADTISETSPTRQDYPRWAEQVAAGAAAHQNPTCTTCADTHLSPTHTSTQQPTTEIVPCTDCTDGTWWDPKLIAQAATHQQQLDADRSAATTSERAQATSGRTGAHGAAADPNAASVLATRGLPTAARAAATPAPAPARLAGPRAAPTSQPHPRRAP